MSILWTMLVAGCQAQGQADPQISLAAEIVESSQMTTPSATIQGAAPTVTLAIPTATEIGRLPEIRLEDDFESSESCLESFERADASAFIFEGQMILDVVAPETRVISTCQSLVAGNFILESQTRVLNAPQDTPFYYGLTFRVSGEESYNFVFGSVGGYCIFFASPNGILHLTNSTDFVTDCWALPPADAVNLETNQLRVVAVDDRMDFFINDVLMAVVRDNRLSEGQVGYLVTSGAAGGVRVAFDNLRVLRP